MELVTGSQGDSEADQPELPYLASTTDFIVGSEALAHRFLGQQSGPGAEIGAPGKAMELVTGSQGDGEADQPELPYLASITDFVVGSEALAQLKKSLAELISLVDGGKTIETPVEKPTNLKPP